MGRKTQYGIYSFPAISKVLFSLYLYIFFFCDQKPKPNLLAMAAGIKQKENVNKIMKKVKNSFNVSR